MAKSTIDPDFKKKWVKALRSNKYKQGQYDLRRTDYEGETFWCCLRIAADVSGKDKWEPHKNYGEDDPRCTYYWGKTDPWDGTGPESYVRPGTIRGLTQNVQEELSEMNDSGDWSFKKIANWIEKNLACG